jgi:hypothetical protein
MRFYDKTISLKRCKTEMCPKNVEDNTVRLRLKTVKAILEHGVNLHEAIKAYVAG